MHFPINPMLCEPHQAPTNEQLTYPFSHPGWAYELKWDGHRAIVQIASHGVTIWTRSGRIVNSEYPELVKALDGAVTPAQKPVVLDGEIIWMHDGWPDRQRLQNRMRATPEARRRGLKYVVFDMLHFKGADIMNLRYDERRSHLNHLKPNANVTVGISVPDGGAMWSLVKKSNLEGLVAKPIASKYLPGNRGVWLKIKSNVRDVFTVVGYTAGEGTRSGAFGSLILAKKDEEDRYLYAGKVGTGFSVVGAKQLLRKMQPVEESPIAKFDRLRALKHITAKRPITWVEPDLEAVVEYSDTTNDGIPLFPSFKGLQ